MDEKILEFDKIKEMLEQLAYTTKAKEQIQKLSPYLEEIKVTAGLRETTEAKAMIEAYGNPPLTSMEGIAEITSLAKSEACLSAEQLETMAVSLTSIKRLKDYLSRCKTLKLSLPYYDENLDSLEDIRTELMQKIRAGKVDDYATKTLHSLRADIKRIQDKMREKADACLRANKDCMSDSFSTIRNGHICVPVKKECKFRISGTVIDKSSTGNTLFIEPVAVAKLLSELSELIIHEDNEVRKILYSLTALLADTAEIIEQNESTLCKLDFAFAKAKLSLTMKGTEPSINTNRKLLIMNGRHPLMDASICVPLNFSIGGETNGIVITGPNTGGKTVAIKTVGLMCIMAQSGLHVPAEGANICLNNQILCDIGDGQNISENLSTFSAHITNVLRILKKATKESLIIMDELGSGTDPTEGMGIAVAVLEELRKSNALFFVTTHYPEIKNYASKTEGIINARMTFDRESLRPLYQLEIGSAGESCALYIAKRLGMSDSMLKVASVAAYGNTASEASICDRLFHTDVRNNELKHDTSPLIKKKKTPSINMKKALAFSLGDSVMVYPDNKIGIVCETANDKGVLRVQMANHKKVYVNYKRVKLKVAATELYPPDYDYSIVFDSVKLRKAHHEMRRKYVEGAIEVE